MQKNVSLQDLVDEIDKPRVRTSDTWRVVVAGEFESGKSTVINALLRRPILPSNPALIARPKIRISHAITPIIHAEDTMGRDFNPSSMNDLVENKHLSHCTLKIPLGNLQGIEIVEVPFHPESGIARRDFEMIADADMIVWVTIASQAWRLSEKAVIEKLPYNVRDKSILAISRADKLKTGADLDKIETRLQADANSFFSEIVFMQASTEKLNRAVSETRAWEETGGAALASIAHELVVMPMKAAKKAAE